MKHVKSFDFHLAVNDLLCLRSEYSEQHHVFLRERTSRVRFEVVTEHFVSDAIIKRLANDILFMGEPVGLDFTEDIQGICGGRFK